MTTTKPLLKVGLLRRNHLDNDRSAIEQQAAAEPDGMI